VNFEQLIAPVSLQTFVSDYKGENYFVCKGEASRFEPLFNWTNLNNVLFTHRLTYPRFRLLKNGEVVEPASYIDTRRDRRGVNYEKVNSQKLVQKLTEGCAIHILSVEEFSLQLSEICMEIGNFTKGEVGVTLHVGIKESKGLNLHWDSHDVLVIHLHGRKRWRLYGFTQKHPFRIGPSRSEHISNKIVWEGDLLPGQVLYIPRGFWHEAQAYDEACMHLSIGMFNPKGTDYLTWLGIQLLELDFFRKDIPIDSSHDKFIEDFKSRLMNYINVNSLLAFQNSLIKKNDSSNFNLPNLM
jgi:ribosomal protein L16 Arg81 hydroxylase